ncbi:transmembrane protein 138 [Diorhabda carinulata]|uniref:transmembrane protein 138 n=1 Tax=Diorhabda sublineata TaxID=1163346 RepID=UPI0024E0ED1B|nr:transmembrane protein 138 [Diorhabda sublineata]XP_057651808.1 transmembrane protein 138 [Diorhabda carinulata]XP_057651891.1 transmembrane protein 138 [Diorhabda carinulata]
MKLHTTRYIVILSIQIGLIIIDWFINIFSIFNRDSNAKMLIMFITQNACLILALSVLLLTFFSTYLFQIGLIYLLYERFRTTLLVCMLYFILTSIVNVWLMILQWNNKRNSWNALFMIIFIIQRFMSTVYYYYYKRAALRISDPRFYEDMDIESEKTVSTHD